MTKPDSRAAALELIECVLNHKRPLDEALDASEALRRLESRDRALAHMIAATTLRRLGQIDALIDHCLDKPLPKKARRAVHILRIGITQLLFMDIPDHAALDSTVELAALGPAQPYKKLINAVLRRLQREGAEPLAAQDAARLNTPDWLWQDWARSFGEDRARAIAEAHLHQAPVDLTLKQASEMDRWAEKLSAIPLPTGSLRLTPSGSITELAGFAEGAWWVQDAAAALPARLLGEVQGQTVADLCAAPGGKTAQLAAAGGTVTAVDRSPARLKRVAENLNRLGLSAELVEHDAAAWQPETRFDAVLVDAPCTATGTIRRHPDVQRLKTPDDVTGLAMAQSRILKAGIRLLKPGGRLVYCTCSLQPGEGEAVVHRAMTEIGGVRLDPIHPAEIGGQADWITAEGALRTLPVHLAEFGGMDGFYAVRLIRDAAA